MGRAGSPGRLKKGVPEAKKSSMSQTPVSKSSPDAPALPPQGMVPKHLDFFTLADIVIGPTITPNGDRDVPGHQNLVAPALRGRPAPVARRVQRREGLDDGRVAGRGRRACAAA